MMKCPRTSDILEMLSNRLDSERSPELRAHIAACAICAEALRELEVPWTALGSWTLEPSAVDVVDAVLERAGHVEQAPAPGRMALWRRPLRIAASIAIAAGLGIGAGSVVPVPAFSTEPSEEQVAESLGLTAFATDSATGLLAALELPDAGEEAEGGAP
jgi:anti-sigma factor RsiW